MRPILWLVVAALALGGAAAVWLLNGRLLSGDSRGLAPGPVASPASAETALPRDSPSEHHDLPVEPGPMHFTDVTPESGVDFVHVSGDSPEKPFPAANGSGAAAFDFDLDGNVDLYFLTGTYLTSTSSDSSRPPPSNRCYRNLGEWRFADVTDRAGLRETGYSAGAAVGDIDADGFPDVFLNGFGPHRLYRNQGDGTFIEVGAAARVDEDQWGTSAAFLDYDGDGLLDLYVCHYGLWGLETNHYCGDESRGVRVFCNPTTVEPAPHALFHNEGDGTFRNASREAGVGDARGRGQGVVAADLDGDGRTDLFVGNDLSGNFLFLNTGDGAFRDASQDSGTASDYLGRNQAGMGVDAADLNHDGRLDLFVTTFEGEHKSFYENLGNGLFQEVSRTRGLATAGVPWVGWGTALADFDLDGWPDVVVTNGHTDANLRDMGRDSPYDQPPVLWHNIHGKFVSAGGAAAGGYFARTHVGRGLAVADFDNDGDLDLVITHQDARPALLRNDCVSATEPGWIRVQLIGTVSNREAVGAEVRLTSETGSQIAQQIKGGGSYLCAHDLRQIIALSGHADAAKLSIRWPSGKTTEVAPLAPRTTHRIVEPD